MKDTPGSSSGGRRRARRDQIRGRRRRRRIRRLVVLSIAITLLGGSIWMMFPTVKGFIRDAITTAEVDYPAGGSGEEVSVTIPKGASGAKMAQILKAADIIHTSATFSSVFAQNERSGKIQPGTYKLRTKMSATEALSALLDPVNRADSSLTIPEGFRADQVYDRIAAQLSVPVAKVKEAAADASGIGLPAEAKGNPEGWLLPQTYSFAPDATPTYVLHEMVTATVAQLEDLKIPRERWQEVLTKASIVQGEVPKTYYGNAARVIENRLADKTGPTVGRLQMDSTVLYGLGKRGIPSSDEVRKDTPYNTYIHTGLPPTPIGSPSRGAIQAVLNPPAGDWLYFVTVNLDSGETVFTGSYEEHQKNIQQLRDWRAAKGKKASPSPSSDG